MTPKRRPLRQVDLDALPDYLTIGDIAELLDVQPGTAQTITRAYAGFPAPAFHGRGVWARDGVLAWLRTKPRLLRSRGASALVDEHGDVPASGSLPTYLTRSDIARLLDVPARVVSDAARSSPGFPSRAFGGASVAYPTDRVVDFLLRREQGWEGIERPQPGPDQQLLSVSDVAAVLGLSDRSMATYRTGQHAGLFPAPALDAETGRPHRPLRFHRVEVAAYVQALLDRGRASTPHIKAFLNPRGPR